MELANLDWNSLGFGYIDTDYNVRCTYKDGKWGELEVTDKKTIDLHMAATCLHYGQECFEGMKAFRGKDGKIRIFRLQAGAERMQTSCRGILMPEMPIDLYMDAVRLAVKKNERFVPPYESDASLYIRPLIIGSSAQVGVKPAQEYTLIVFVTPVGPYFKEGIKPTKMRIMREYDRAAPLGTGRYKVGGNYAASLSSTVIAHNEGYSNPIYLAATEKKYIAECGAANFFGIRDNTYITPKSDSILPSITNKCLQALAEHLGMKVECRPVPEEELATFEEAAACGTAAVISPISQIDDPVRGVSYTYTTDGTVGPCCRKLYDLLCAIRKGETEDIFGWNDILD